MPRLRRLLPVIFGIFALLAFGCSKKEAVSKPEESHEGGPCCTPESDVKLTAEPDAPKLALPLPEFAFADQNSQAFTRDTMKGKVWVACFFFVKCNGPCPDMTKGLAALQALTKDLPDLRFLSVTVDPMNDSAADLADYGKRYGADPKRWSFIRGGLKETRSLALDGFKIGDKDDSLNHSTRFVLVDKDTTIRGYYQWTEDSDRTKLIEDAKKLVAGAAL